MTFGNKSQERIWETIKTEMEYSEWENVPIGTMIMLIGEILAYLGRYYINSNKD